MNIHFGITDFGRKVPSRMHVGPELWPHVFICVHIYIYICVAWLRQGPWPHVFECINIYTYTNKYSYIYIYISLYIYVTGLAEDRALPICKYDRYKWP